ncbi:DNA topoisomerase 4 subunit A [Salmonella enterica subsp. enterica]|nr:DNA topoisomerase 4 subunit A [Salmonella enterica subsp. enterica]
MTRNCWMASDAGYGFVCTFNDLVARNRAGKALITLPENAHVMPPLVIEDEHDMLAGDYPGRTDVDVPGRLSAAAVERQRE